MRLLVIGTDQKIFESGSPSRARLMSYSQYFDEMHIIIFSLRSQRLQEMHSGSFHLYPTNSRSKLLYVFDAARIARKLSGEIITVQDPFECGIAGLFGKKGRPLHVQLHTDMFAKEFARGLNRFRLHIAPFVFSRATRIRTLTEKLKKNIEERYNPKVPISVIPIFVDTEKFRSLKRTPHPRFRPSLLWVGRFEDEKNPLVALEALTTLRESHKEAGLVLLGDGSLKGFLEEKSKEFGIEHWIEFPGWQDPLPFMGVADLLLVTSKYEGYCLAIIEALAAGIPVLSTDVGVAREEGTLIAGEEVFSAALEEWVKSGHRTAELKKYPYQDFKGYVQAWVNDIVESIRP